MRPSRNPRNAPVSIPTPEPRPLTSPGPDPKPIMVPRPASVPAPAPRRRVRRAPAPGEGIPWGWLEWFVILQTFIPALLFIPGLSAVRTATRIGAYAPGLVAWGGVALGPKGAATSGSFPA